MKTRKQLREHIQTEQLKAFAVEKKRLSTTCLASLDITPRWCEWGRLEVPNYNDLDPAGRWHAEWRSHRLGGFSSPATEFVISQHDDDLGRLRPWQKLEIDRRIDQEEYEASKESIDSVMPA
jgi:hypothetical protein